MKGRRCVGDAVQHHPLRRAKVVHKSLVETTCQGRFWFNIEGRIPTVSDGDTTTVALDIATGSMFDIFSHLFRCVAGRAWEWLNEKIRCAQHAKPAKPSSLRPR